MNAVTREPSVGALLGSLASQTAALVHQEVRLASTEMGQKAKSAAIDLGYLGAGGALVHAGLLVLMAAVILGLGPLVPIWVSALVIGVVATGAGWALVHRGMTALRSLDPVPEHTVQTLLRDKAWMQEQLR